MNNTTAVNKMTWEQFPEQLKGAIDDVKRAARLHKLALNDWSNQIDSKTHKAVFIEMGEKHAHALADLLAVLWNRYRVPVIPINIKELINQ